MSDNDRHEIDFQFIYDDENIEKSVSDAVDFFLEEENLLPTMAVSLVMSTFVQVVEGVSDEEVGKAYKHLYQKYLQSTVYIQSRLEEDTNEK